MKWTQEDFDAELRHIQEEEASGLGLITHRTGRVLTRSFRIAVGIGFGIGAWACYGPVDETFSRPLGSLTISEILGAVFLIALGFGLIKIGWWAAFGEGPTAEETLKRQKTLAQTRLNSRGAPKPLDHDLPADYRRREPRLSDE